MFLLYYHFLAIISINNFCLIYSGRKFDKNGNMLPWWSNDTIESYINLTQCFVDQYSTYYVSELDEHVSL